MINRVLTLSMLISFGVACTSEKANTTNACVDRIKKRLVAPGSIAIQSAEVVKPALFSTTDYARAMAQSAAEFRVESARASTDGEKIAADAGARFIGSLDLSKQFIRDVETGSQVSSIQVQFESQNRLGVPLPGRATCFSIDNPSGSDKFFLVMNDH